MISMTYKSLFLLNFSDWSCAFCWARVAFLWALLKPIGPLRLERNTALTVFAPTFELTCDSRFLIQYSYYRGNRSRSQILNAQ